MRLGRRSWTLGEGERHIAFSPAGKDAVIQVIAADEASEDGRSEWLWIMLPDGDWVLGVFPQGDTYLLTEKDRV